LHAVLQHALVERALVLELLRAVASEDEVQEIVAAVQGKRENLVLVALVYDHGDFLEVFKAACEL